MEDKKNKTSAANVIRLSPPELFEALLGDPEDSGYDEDTLKEKFEKSAEFACDSRSSRTWIEDNKKSERKTENK
ncbi:MAG: hypothetical protein V1874_05375 [Spirochaetota bacterium]